MASKRFLPPGYFEQVAPKESPNHFPKVDSIDNYIRIEPTVDNSGAEDVQEQVLQPKRGISKKISISAILLSLLIIALLLRVSSLQKGVIQFVLAEDSRYNSQQIFEMTSLDSLGVYTFDDIPYIISSVQSILGVLSVTTDQTMQGAIQVLVDFYPPVAIVEQAGGYTYIDSMGILYEQEVPEAEIGSYPLFTGLHSWKGSDYEIRSLLSDLRRVYQEFPEFQSEVSEIVFDGVTSGGEYRALVYPVRYPITVVISADLSGEALRMGWELMEFLYQQGSLEEYATLSITEEGVMYKRKEIAHGS